MFKTSDNPAFFGPPVAVVAIFIGLLDLVTGVATNMIGLAVGVASMLFLFRPFRHSPLGQILIFTGAAIYTVPYLSLIYIDYDVQLAWFFFYNVVSYILLVSSVNRDGADKGHVFSRPITVNAVPNLTALFLILVLMLVGSAQGGGLGGAFFLGSWGIALVQLDRLRFSGRKPPVVLGAAMIAVAIFLYSVLIWEGFGRIVLLSMLLGPFLLALCAADIKIPGMFFFALGAVMVFVGRVLRFGFSEGIAGISEDSGASHIILTSELYSQSHQAHYVTTFLEQYVLFFMNWFPRELWSGKPLGINYTLVDGYIGRQGLGEEHSTAVGFFGEHVFYTPIFWPLTLLVVVLTVIVLRRLLVWLSGRYVSGPLIFDLWLTTLFWGGMAVTASRLWFCLLPALGYMWLLRAIDGSGRTVDATAPMSSPALDKQSRPEASSFSSRPPSRLEPSRPGGAPR